MINLLPPKQRLEIETAKRNTLLRRYLELGLLCVLVVTLLVIGSYYFLKLQENNTQKSLDLNNQKLSQLEPVQAEAQQLSSTINTISALFSREVNFSSMLTDIGQLMPPRSVLLKLELTSDAKDTPLTVSAQTDTEETAAVLRNNLEKSKLFEKANIISITKIGSSTTTNNPTTSSSKDSDSKKDSPYKFTVQIEAYFASNGGKK